MDPTFRLLDGVAQIMGTSPFDPRVKRTHSRLQAMILIARRFPKQLEQQQNDNLARDAYAAEAEDVATFTDDYDIWAEEGFDVDDEEI